MKIFHYTVFQVAYYDTPKDQLLNENTVVAELTQSKYGWSLHYVKLVWIKYLGLKVQGTKLTTVVVLVQQKQRDITQLLFHN